MRKRTLAREHALKILYQININGESVEDALSGYFDHMPETVESEVKEFAERLVKGTIEHVGQIDQIIARYAENWDLSRMAVIDRNVLRYATYELLFLAREIPPKVVINESVNVAKKFSTEESGRFVNGVLDKINHAEARFLQTPPAA